MFNMGFRNASKKGLDKKNVIKNRDGNTFLKETKDAY